MICRLSLLSSPTFWDSNNYYRIGLPFELQLFILKFTFRFCLRIIIVILYPVLIVIVKFSIKNQATPP
jgi:hypothetical protein